MKTVHVAGAVIVNSQNQIFCARRAPHVPLGGMWEFPGGKIENGETPEQALIREIAEELQLVIEVGALVAECHHQYPQVLVHLLTFYARIVSGEPHTSDHDAFIWLDRTQLRSLEWAPADIPTVDVLTADQPKGSYR